MFKTITPISSIIIAIALFFFFTQPMFADIKSIQDETAEYREAVAKASEFNQLLQSLIQKRNSFSAREMERLEALVPDEIDEVKILVDIQELARKHRMLFGNISVSSGNVSAESADTVQNSKVAIEDFNAKDIDFELIGTYEQFRSMLSDLEKSLVIMEVVEISFSAGDEDLQQYKVKVRTYALPPIQQ